jgi:hypothetical protein
LRNAIATHPEIKRRRAREAHSKVRLNEKYTIEHLAWESWCDPGICTGHHSYCAYGRRWYGWKKIFYAESSRGGVLSLSFQNANVYRWRRRRRPELEELLQLVQTGKVQEENKEEK